MAAVTVSQVRQVLIAALNKAIRDGILVRNVAKDAESPRVEDSVPFAMTPEMARAIAAACGDYSDELRRAVVFGISTGVRWGEQQALRWSDVDLDGGYLVVQHSMTRTYSAEGGNVLSPVKTPRSRRRVELGPSAIDLLKTERANQTEAVGPIPGLVFRDSKGNDRRNDPRHLQTALKRAGLLVRPDTGKPLTWDACCREGHASLLLQQGWNLKAVADRLGNTPAILAKHYAGITQAEQVRIGSSLEALDIG
jgi:integrase